MAVRPGTLVPLAVPTVEVYGPQEEMTSKSYVQAKRGWLRMARCTGAVYGLDAARFALDIHIAAAELAQVRRTLPSPKISLA